MKKQSYTDRIKRLEDNRCPIHGLGFTQFDCEIILMSCGHYQYGRHIAKCPRRDCEIKAYSNGNMSNSGAQLLTEYFYILNNCST